MAENKDSSQDHSDVADDFPPKPEMLQANKGINKANLKMKQSTVSAIVLISLTNFFYGAGISIYGPLFPMQAAAKGASIGIYGLILASSHLATILFYPVACLMASSVSLKLFFSMTIVTSACCKILFGTLALFPNGAWFFSLSFAIQIVDGMGTASLMTASFSLMLSEFQDKAGKMIAWMLLFLLLGVAAGPIAGIAVYTAAGFGVPFYGVGVLSALTVCVVAIISESDHKMYLLTFSWMKSSRMLIYFFLIFASFNYSGFIAVTLEQHLRKLDMEFIFVGMLFGFPVFVCGLTAPLWKWLTEKGHINGLLFSCISSSLIMASVILIGPAPFTNLKISISNVTVALLLKGLGTSGKLVGIVSAAVRDIKTKAVIIDNFNQALIPIIFTLGAFSGLFVGSTTAGFTSDYIGFPKATFFLLGLEALMAAVALIFAFHRNYRSTRHHASAEERSPVLES